MRYAFVKFTIATCSCVLAITSAYVFTVIYYNW